MDLGKLLIDWYTINKRDLPWRRTSDPYLIWLSEIILQQTRVDQGMPYYETFSTTFPTVQDLAEAPEDQILKLWQGLGYYSRARNLHKAAKMVVNTYAGKFPSTYDELLKLPGIGHYTASAVSSFAANEVRAVVDGNVYRVLARVFGIATPIDSTAGAKEFNALAQELIDPSEPGNYNQAIMEFGALKCVPKSPDCETCPMMAKCVGFAQNQVNVLPVKTAKTKVKTQYLNYLVINHADQILVHKRTSKGIWQNLYDFPHLTSDKKLTAAAVLESPILTEIAGGQSFTIRQETGLFKHQLSHRLLHAKFWVLELEEPPILPSNCSLVPKSEYENLAIPRLVDKFWQSQELTTP